MSKKWKNPEMPRGVAVVFGLILALMALERVFALYMGFATGNW